ncbi:hypothetical protein [Pontibacter liquoris]|uniref:hypothetical protein n=1 Tax=Pontibacter liquoris TaxID=2905677 RepID=UPI001FA6E3E6|nr:hypothetical protein [Pontibacter liquoris]
MLKIPVTCLPLLCLLTACSPENEQVTQEQIETKPVADALDTIANTRKDALKIDKHPVSLPLPQPVLELLTQHYPGWEQPTLAATAQQHAPADGQGPTLVRGDFNGDNRQDYVLQLQQKNNVILVVVLDAANGNWELAELKRDVLFNDRNTLKSLYYVYLVPKGEELRPSGTSAPAHAPADAPGVGMEDSHTVYLYQNGRFIAIRLKD